MLIIVILVDYQHWPVSALWVLRRIIFRWWWLCVRNKMKNGQEKRTITTHVDRRGQWATSNYRRLSYGGKEKLGYSMWLCAKSLMGVGSLKSVIFIVKTEVCFLILLLFSCYYCCSMWIVLFCVIWIEVGYIGAIGERRGEWE